MNERAPNRYFMADKKLSKKVKWGLWISAFTIPILFFMIGSMDASSQDYSAVTPAPRSLPSDENNVFYLLAKVPTFNEYKHPWYQKIFSNTQLNSENPFHHEHQWDQKFWTEVLDRHKTDLAQLRKAYSAPQFYLKPKYSINHTGKEIIDLISKNRLLKVALLDNIYNSNWDAVFADLELQQRYSKIHLQGSDLLVSLLTAVAIHSSQHEILNLIIERNASPSFAIQKCISLLQFDSLPLLKKRLTEAYKHEFLLMQKVLDSEELSLYLKEVNSWWGRAYSIPYCFHKNRLLNQNAELVKNFVSFESMRPRQIHHKITQLDQLLARSTPPWNALLPNSLGRALMAESGTIVGWQAIHIYQNKVHSNLITLKAAARIYKREHGEYPDTLACLNPLIKSPLYDPMEAPKTSYKYDKERKVIWSIGPDFIDDNGPLDSIITSREQSNFSDSTIHLNFSFRDAIDQSTEKPTAP